MHSFNSWESSPERQPRKGPGEEGWPDAGRASHVRTGAPPTTSLRCPRRYLGTRSVGAAPTREGPKAVTPRGGRGWEPGSSPSLVPSRPSPALREPRRPPARGRSAVHAPPGSGARNSAEGAWFPCSPRAPWRGGAGALLRRWGGSGAGPRGGGPQAVRRLRGGA